MSYMDLYKKRVSSKGATIYDRIIKEQHDNFYNYLARTPERESIRIIDPTQKDEDSKFSLPHIVAILSKKEQEKEKYFQILAPLEVPLDQGTLVEWNDSVWMIFVADEKYKKTHFKGVLKKCNNFLKWIDKYGHLCSVNCYIKGSSKPDFEYKTSSSGFGSTFEFAYAKVSGDIEVILPKNKQTNLLKEQDIFILHNKAWELTEMDDFSYEGIIGLLLKRVMVDSINDDLINDIAEIDRLNSWRIVIENGLTHSLIAAGQTQKLDINIYKDNNIVTSDIPKLNYSIEDPNIIKFDLDTNTIIALKDGTTKLRIFIDECVDFFVELNVEVGGISELEVFYSVTGDDILKEGGNEYTYTARRVYNGEEDVLANFEFSVVDGRKLVQLTKINRNTCIIKTNNQSRYGKIVLKVTDGLELQKKNITIESFI